MTTHELSGDGLDLLIEAIKPHLNDKSLATLECPVRGKAAREAWAEDAWQVANDGSEGEEWQIEIGSYYSKTGDPVYVTLDQDWFEGRAND